MSTVVSQAVLPTYARQDVTLVSGEGAWVVDTEGRRYLDFLAGIAVVGLGHGHPAPLAAAHAQLDRLWHVSNLYWTEPMTQLAERLSQRFGGAQAFFCNSGAEAIEAALKYARKSSGRAGVVALEGSFHGRTCGALSVTGQPAKRAAFEPLLPGVAFAEPNDVASLEAAVTDETGCILLEPVLGEGGIIPLDSRFVEAARALADDAGALLVLDEVQTGVGRTGTFFAFEQLGVRPDAITLAKGLANGLPIGCLLVADSAHRQHLSRATMRAPSAATPSLAPQPSPSATRSTTSCSQVWSRTARRSRPGCRTSVGAGCCSPSTRRVRRRTSLRSAWNAGCSSEQPARALCG